MNIPDCSKDSVEVVGGGRSSVSRGTYRGRQVAIKVVRLGIASDPDVILSVSVLLLHILTYLDECIAEILPRGGYLEASSTPKHLTASRSDGEQLPVRDGFRMDGEREYQ